MRGRRWASMTVRRAFGRAARSGTWLGHGANALQQGIAQERLLDDRNAVMRRPVSQGRARMAGDEDGGGADAPQPQFREQLEAGHAWHVLVDNQAGTAGDVGGVEEVGAGRVGADRKSFDLQRELERIADRRVVVDNNNRHALACGFAGKAHTCRPRRGCDSGGWCRNNHGTATRALIWLKGRWP